MAVRVWLVPVAIAACAAAQPDPAALQNERGELTVAMLKAVAAGKDADAVAAADGVLARTLALRAADHSDVADARLLAAAAREAAGDFAGALDHRRRIADWLEAQRGAKDWRTAAARRDVWLVETAGRLPPAERGPLAAAVRADRQGQALTALGKTADAEKALLAAADWYEKALGKTAVEAGFSLHRVAGMRSDAGDHKGADDANRRAAGFLRAGLTAPHPKLVDVLYELAAFGLDTGAADRGAAEAREGLAAATALFGKDNPATARGQWLLGEAHAGLGKHVEARACHEEAARVYRKAGPAEEEQLASALMSLGSSHRLLGDLAAARKCHEEVLATFRRLRPAGHPDIGRGLSNLSLVLREQRELAAARECSEEAVAVFRAALGKDHRLTGRATSHLGLVLTAEGDPAGALRHLKEALRVVRLHRPENHPEVAAELAHVGQALQAADDWAAAKPYFEQALKTFRATLPPTHPFVSSAENDVGSALRALGELDAARRHLETALAGLRAALPAGHPGIIAGLSNLGCAAEDQGD